MDEDVSARVLLRNVLQSEPPRSPVTRSVSQDKAESLVRRSVRVRRCDAGGMTPKEALRRSLKHKLHESASSLIPSKRTENKPTPSSTGRYEDEATPRYLLRNILRTEMEVSVLQQDRRELKAPVDVSVASSRSSTGISALDLSDITLANVASTSKGLKRKRPRRSINVTAFERQLDCGDGNQAEEATAELSSSSLGMTVHLKTPYVDVATEKRGLQRKALSRRKITEEEFGMAVDQRHTAGEVPEQRRHVFSETGGREAFTLGLTNLSEPNVTADISTALYSHIGNTSSILLTQDKVTIAASQLQNLQQMAEEEAPNNEGQHKTEDTGGHTEEEEEEEEDDAGGQPEEVEEEAGGQPEEEEEAERQADEEEEESEGQKEEEVVAEGQSEEEEEEAERQAEEEEVETEEHNKEEEEEAERQAEEEEVETEEQNEEEEDEEEAERQAEEEEVETEEQNEEEEDEEEAERQAEEEEVETEEQNEEEEVEADGQPEEEEEEAEGQAEEEEEEAEGKAETEGVGGVTSEDDMYLSSHVEEEELKTDLSKQLEAIEDDGNQEHISGGADSCEGGAVLPVTEDGDMSPRAELAAECVGEEKENSSEESCAPADHAESSSPSLEGDLSEELSMKTPAFVRQKRFLPSYSGSSSKVLKDVQAHGKESDGAPPEPRMTKVKSTRRAQKEPGLPKCYLMGVFKHFAKTRVSPDVYLVLKDVMDKYFDRLVEDLETFSKHAGRKTIEPEDVTLLLRRQGFINDKVPVEVLIEKYLPMEYRKLLIPVATSGNVVIPKQKR